MFCGSELIFEAEIKLWMRSRKWPTGSLKVTFRWKFRSILSRVNSFDLTFETFLDFWPKNLISDNRDRLTWTFRYFWRFLPSLAISPQALLQMVSCPTSRNRLTAKSRCTMRDKFSLLKILTKYSNSLHEFILPGKFTLFARKPWRTCRILY